MAVLLDHEQKIAVETSGISVVLTAGAGCGKTGTIVEKFLSLVESGQELGRIAVLTFTNKAAAELRHRIRAGCLERAKTQFQNAGTIDWSLIAFAIDGVTISTYHSFYEQLCREFAEVVGLDPDFRLIDDRIALGLRQQAALEALRNRLSQSDDVLVEYAARIRLDGVVSQIVQLMDKSEDAQLEQLAEITPESLAAKWQKAADQATDQIRETFRLILDEWRVMDRTGMTDFWVNCMSNIDLICSRTDIDPRDFVSQVQNKFKGARRPKSPWDVHFDKYKAIKESDDFPLLLASNSLLNQAAAETVLLARLVVDTRAIYQQAKERRRCVDFDDLVARSEDLSRAGVNLGYKMATRFDVLLVDEFQDTDSKQARILKNLCGAGFDCGQLFVVGDIKQAIYRFRGAKPEELYNLRDEMPAEGRQSLVRNYRSRSRIIKFVNAIAANLYPQEKPLLVGLPHETARNDQEPAVDFLWTVFINDKDKDKDDNDDAESPPSAMSLPNEDIHHEAEYLAQFVRDMIDNKVQVGARSGTLRHVEPRDVVVISRSRTHWWIFERAFQKQNLKVIQDNVGKLFDRQEIRDLITLLAVVENPMDDLRLAAVMRGPFGSLTDETLFWINETGSNASFAEKFWNLNLYNGSEINDEEWSSIVDLKELINNLRQVKATIRPSEVVRMAIKMTAFEQVIRATGTEPERAIGNLDRLVEDAVSFDHDPDFGYSAMIRQWINDVEHGAKENEAVVEPPKDCIRFLTVHSSKGLQFPVVLMPGLNSKQSPDNHAWSIHPQFGLVTRSRNSDTDESDENDDHAAWLLSRRAEKLEGDKETDNLLYVGLTRAEDQLVLSAAFKVKAENDELKPGGAFLKRIENSVGLKTGTVAGSPDSEPIARVHLNVQSRRLTPVM